MGKVGEDRRPGLDGWLRALPYALIGMSLLLAALAGGPANALRWGLPATTVGAGLAAGWTFVMVRRPGGAEPSDRRLAVYFVVRLLLTAALVMINPWFGVYAWYAYVEAMSYFTVRWALVAIGATSLISALSFLGGHVAPTVGGWVLYLVLAAGNAALAGAIAVSTLHSIDQQAERDAMMDEMVLANDRLAAALAENRALADQLLEQAREAGMMDERARLAGEIHDTLAQTLTGIITQLEAADGAGELRHPGVRHAGAALSLARSGLTDARRSLQALRPERLVGSRLPEAVSQTAAQWSELSGVPATLDVTGSVVPLDAEREIAALRVAQEGLANVAKHARASRVWITLSYLDGEVLIDVRDDGTGFHPEPIAAGTGGHAIGLVSMRERLARVGGELQIESELGQGTTLVARIPFPCNNGESPSLDSDQRTAPDAAGAAS